MYFVRLAFIFLLGSSGTGTRPDLGAASPWVRTLALRSKQVRAIAAITQVLGHQHTSASALIPNTGRNCSRSESDIWQKTRVTSCRRCTRLQYFTNPMPVPRFPRLDGSRVNLTFSDTGSRQQLP